MPEAIKYAYENPSNLLPLLPPAHLRPPSPPILPPEYLHSLSSPRVASTCNTTTPSPVKSEPMSLSCSEEFTDHEPLPSSSKLPSRSSSPTLLSSEISESSTKNLDKLLQQKTPSPPSQICVHTDEPVKRKLRQSLDQDANNDNEARLQQLDDSEELDENATKLDTKIIGRSLLSSVDSEMSELTSRRMLSGISAMAAAAMAEHEDFASSPLNDKTEELVDAHNIIGNKKMKINHVINSVSCQVNNCDKYSQDKNLNEPVDKIHSNGDIDAEEWISKKEIDGFDNNNKTIPNKTNFEKKASLLSGDKRLVEKINDFDKTEVCKNGDGSDIIDRYAAVASKEDHNRQEAKCTLTFSGIELNDQKTDSESKPTKITSCQKHQQTSHGETVPKASDRQSADNVDNSVRTGGALEVSTSSVPCVSSITARCLKSIAPVPPGPGVASDTEPSAPAKSPSSDWPSNIMDISDDASGISDRLSDTNSSASSCVISTVKVTPTIQYSNQSNKLNTVSQFSTTGKTFTILNRSSNNHMLPNSVFANHASSNKSSKNIVNNCFKAVLSSNLSSQKSSDSAFTTYKNTNANSNQMRSKINLPTVHYTLKCNNHPRLGQAESASRLTPDSCSSSVASSCLPSAALPSGTNTESLAMPPATVTLNKPSQEDVSLVSRDYRHV